jgi:hypothetical protein
MKNLKKRAFLFKTTLFITFFYFQPFSSRSQEIQLTPIPNMPFAVSNNAVSNGTNAMGQMCIYSFGGIDSTKLFSGINNRVLRFNTATNVWTELDSLPGSQRNIAMGASTIRNKIYIIGGYSVFSNGNEASTNQVHIFDPETETYSSGSLIPVPIDDHVQCVWKDSLIFIITGWSNTGNVPNVQIYNPSFDSWSIGTSVPNNNQYKAFGATGTIIGDTIYYLGGASNGVNFPCQSILRKGIIDPSNPTSISWVNEGNLQNTYRGVTFSDINQNLYFIGGSSVSYNYDGIAYNGSGGVDPSNKVQFYQSLEPNQIIYDSVSLPMDLRGIASISPSLKYIAGGMETSQQVSKKAFKIEISTNLTLLDKKLSKNIPNPLPVIVDLSAFEDLNNAALYDQLGKIHPMQLVNTSWYTSDLPSGIYVLHLESPARVLRVVKQ